MKIIIFHTEFYFSGGAEHTIFETMQLLSDNGYTVEAWAPYVNTQTCFPDIISNYTIKQLLPGYITKLSIPREIYIIIAALLAPLLVLKVRKSDFFYGANQAGPYFAYVSHLLLGKPYLVYMPYPQGFLYPRKIDIEFGVHTNRTTLSKYILTLIKPVFRIIDKHIMRNAKNVLTEGEYSQKFFESIYKRNIINCPPAASSISPSEAASIDRFSQPYILITNRHMPKKKFEYAIEILVLLKKKHSLSPRVIITGTKTDYTTKIIELAKIHHVDSQIIWRGYTSEQETTDLYKHATVYIYTAPEEDFGKGIIQAMGNNIPVVAWNNGGPTGIIKNAVDGFLVTPFSSDEFAKKVAQLLKDTNLNKKMGNAGRESVKEKFSTGLRLLKLRESLS